MTYEEFLDYPSSFIDDMCSIIKIKRKYNLSFTEEEKQIHQHIMKYMNEMETNKFKYDLERCWELPTDD